MWFLPQIHFTNYSLKFSAKNFLSAGIIGGLKFKGNSSKENHCKSRHSSSCNDSVPEKSSQIYTVSMIYTSFPSG